MRSVEITFYNKRAYINEIVRFAHGEIRVDTDEILRLSRRMKLNPTNLSPA